MCPTVRQGMGAGVSVLASRVVRYENGAVSRAWFYQDQLRPVAEMDASGVISLFVYADGALGGAPDFMVKGGTPYRIVKDHLGSVRLVVNAVTGVVAQRMEYDAFGRVLEDTWPGFQPFGFAGGLYDWDTKLVRFGARDYDPGMGRWTAKDPIGFAGGQANVYVYVGNDPVNRVDPEGLEDPTSWRKLLGGTMVSGALLTGSLFLAGFVTAPATIPVAVGIAVLGGGLVIWDEIDQAISYSNAVDKANEDLAPVRKRTDRVNGQLQEISLSKE
jgi:RHS repeat-associated protein